MTGKILRRGNNSCHYHNFPESVYLHDGLFVKVSEWDSEPISGIDRQALLSELRLRREFFRDSDPLPRSSIELDLRRLRKVYSTVFPLTFYCTVCQKVVHSDNPGDLVLKMKEAEQECRRNGHRFNPRQFRYVSVDSCGFIAEGFDPQRVRCSKHPDKGVVLRTNYSERIANFRWRCAEPGCGTEFRVRGTAHNCLYAQSVRDQRYKEGENPDSTRIELVTKNIVAIPEIFSRVNLQDPRRLEIKQWQNWKKKVFYAATGAIDLVTSDLVTEIRRLKVEESDALEVLRGMKGKNPKTEELISQLVAEMTKKGAKQGEVVADETAEEMLDFLLAVNQPPIGMARSLKNEGSPSIAKIADLGLLDIVLLEELNLTTVLYGYSRGEYTTSKRRLRFFETFDGKRKREVKLYCSPVDTEGLMLVLDPVKVLDFISENCHGNELECEDTTSSIECARAIARIYDRRERLPIFGFRDSDSPNAWLYRLLHSISHLFIRTLGRVAGVEESSIAEMIFPSCCGILLHVNQSGEFNLGTFSNCFDNYLEYVLKDVASRAEDCLYDPICIQDSDGSCPACIQLGEISCENFNRDMSRKYLIGGNDVKGFWQ